MSNITINVKFLAGTDIEEAVKEAKELAIRMDIAYVCFNFNGISISIGKSADINKVIKQYKNDREIIVES